jgi:hypothetical protein
LKKIILFACNILMTSALWAASNPALEQKPCEQTEKSLSYEMSRGGQPRTVEDHVKTAKIYAAMQHVGCPGNAKKYKQHAVASLETARALAEISDSGGRNKSRYNNMINNAFRKTY